MSAITLTQTEADALLKIAKIRADDQEWLYPGLAGSLSIPLLSHDKRENFLLDISRARIVMLRGKYQMRARNALVLARLDFGGPPHRNPDGAEFPCPHLHLYREGLGDKYAVPIPAAAFPNLSDLWQTLHDFMRFCNVTEPPRIRRGLWS
jgi:hypothetical protein